MRAGPLLSLAALLLAGAAGAAGAAAYTDEPMEPEKAFPVRAAIVKDARGAAKAIELRFGVARGYYLYRDRFKVDAPGLPLGTLRIPAGVLKDDPFVGPSRILKQAATVTLPLRRKPDPGTYVLTVTAQGCAEDRVCYAPFAQTVELSLP